MTTREKFHQLICLYELGIIVYKEDADYDSILEMHLHKGLCRASGAIVDDYGFPESVNPEKDGYWWNYPKRFSQPSTNLRALQVRLDWLYEQLNKIK